VLHPCRKLRRIEQRGPLQRSEGAWVWGGFKESLPDRVLSRDARPLTKFSEHREERGALDLPRRTAAAGQSKNRGEGGQGGQNYGRERKKNGEKRREVANLVPGNFENRRKTSQEVKGERVGQRGGKEDDCLRLTKTQHSRLQGLPFSGIVNKIRKNRLELKTVRRGAERKDQDTSFKNYQVPPNHATGNVWGEKFRNRFSELIGGVLTYPGRGKAPGKLGPVAKPSHRGHRFGVGGGGVGRGGGFGGCLFCLFCVVFKASGGNFATRCLLGLGCHATSIIVLFGGLERQSSPSPLVPNGEKTSRAPLLLRGQQYGPYVNQ